MRHGRHQPSLVRQHRSRIVRRGDGAGERRYCFRFVIGYSLSVAQERVQPGDAGVLHRHGLPTLIVILLVYLVMDDDRSYHTAGRVAYWCVQCASR
jgi:hypothetical protein